MKNFAQEKNPHKHKCNQDGFWSRQNHRALQCTGLHLSRRSVHTTQCTEEGQKVFLEKREEKLRKHENLFAASFFFFSVCTMISSVHSLSFTFHLFGETRRY